MEVETEESEASDSDLKRSACVRGASALIEAPRDKEADSRERNTRERREEQEERLIRRIVLPLASGDQEYKPEGSALDLLATLCSNCLPGSSLSNRSPLIFYRFICHHILTFSESLIIPICSSIPLLCLSSALSVRSLLLCSCRFCFSFARHCSALDSFKSLLNFSDPNQPDAVQRFRRGHDDVGEKDFHLLPLQSWSSYQSSDSPTCPSDLRPLSSAISLAGVCCPVVS